MTAGIAVFDLCDTLYADNTTIGFLHLLARDEPRGKVARALRRWTSRRSPFFYAGAAALRLLSVDLARRQLIRALAGERRARLEEAAERYAATVLPPLTNARVHKLLETYRRRGDRLVILSASLDIVVAPVAARLGADYRASVLGFDGERCTGRLVRDLTGAKPAALDELGGRGAARLTVVTDNASDLGLVDLADEAIIVVPAGRQRGEWGGPDRDYLRL